MIMAGIVLGEWIKQYCCPGLSCLSVRACACVCVCVSVCEARKCNQRKRFNGFGTTQNLHVLANSGAFLKESSSLPTRCLLTARANYGMKEVT